MRGREGYSFGRRYVAALLGISLPPRPKTIPVAARQTFQAHTATWDAPTFPPPTPVLAGNTFAAPRQRHRNAWTLTTGWALGGAFVLAALFFVTVNHDSGGAGSAAPISTTGAGESTMDTAYPVPPYNDFSFDDTNLVPQCATLYGTGSLPPEGAAVIWVRPLGDLYIHYGGQVYFDEGIGWQADVRIGAAEDGGKIGRASCRERGWRG